MDLEENRTMELDSEENLDKMLRTLSDKPHDEENLNTRILQAIKTGELDRKYAFVPMGEARDVLAEIRERAEIDKIKQKMKSI